MATLLIIDDDPAVVGILYDLLAGSYDCHTADRAEQALQYLEIEEYDVILSDVSMPGLSGVDVLKRVRARHPSTPVIIISGMGREEKEKMLGLGAFDFFAKPFHLEEIEDAIVKAIASRSTKGTSS